MTKFISNVNKYLSEMKIKQTYLSMITGIDKNKMSIAYSDKNREEIYSMVKRFCSFTGIEYDSDLLNILQIVRSSFQKKYLLA